MPADFFSQLSFPHPNWPVLRLVTSESVRTRRTDEAWLAAIESTLDQLADRATIATLTVSIEAPEADREGLEYAESEWSQSESDRSALADRAARVADRFARLPFPTVAALRGACHGRATEIASWCDLRVARAGAPVTFGFPGVHWGSRPDWGGVARWMRQVDVGQALEWLASGEPVRSDSETANAWLAVIDAPENWLDTPGGVEAACGQELALAFDRRAQRLGPASCEPQRALELAEVALGRLRGAARGHEPAARRLVVAAARSVSLPLAEADAELARATNDEAGVAVQRALRNVAALALHNRRDRGLERPVAETRSIESLIVVGAGIMGAGIAAAALGRGVRVAVVDSNAPALERARESILSQATGNRRARAAADNGRSSVADRLSFHPSIEQAPASDAAIEAVVENPDVKRQVLPALEQRLKPGGLLASNTSTIPIDRLSEGLAAPERCCGIHFFNPVRLMPLVEIIRGPRTSDQTVADAVEFAKRIGKLPIVVRDSPGFLVNRILFAYLNESIQLLHEGARVAQIDRAARGFGMPLGPLELSDMIGIDTVYYAGRTMYSAFPDRALASPIPPVLMKKGRLGTKSGAGFYAYDANRHGSLDEPGQTLLATYRRSEREFTDDQIVERIMFPMLLEATRVLAERVVRDPRDVDFGVIYGLGFPAFRGGLLAWADSLGAAEVLRIIEPYAGLGGRWQPTPLLRELVASGGRFYA